jgi:trimethylamine--corrinoid protein Co-methyltransferase
VFYSIISSVMHPQTAEYINTISEKYLSHAAAIQIAHDWGIPILGGAFGTDTVQPMRWNLGRDSVYNALLTALAGADIVVGLGLLKASTLLVPEQIIFDDEIYHITRVLADGIDLGADELALDVIQDVGPGGHYLRQKHTRRKVRDLWIPTLSHPGLSPQDEHQVDAYERARAELQRILSEHEPQPLEEATQTELKTILDAARKDFDT